MNSGRPLVSIVVAVSEGERYISSALQSIFRQNYSPTEVIVVDGQSVDATAAIARSFKPVKYISQSGRGLANARNTGIAATRGEFIAFLDADDLWTPDKLGIQIDCLLRNRELQYVNAWVRLFAEPGCSLRSGYMQRLMEQAHIGRTPGTLVARRSLFDIVGVFSEDFSIACDVDWFARAIVSGIPTFVIPQVFLHKRIHDNNLSSNTSVNRKELMAVIRRSIMLRRQYEDGVFCVR
jgi:glycosyltransferase involved in cell wall biosynthesis